MKSDWRQLGIVCGSPSFETPLHVGCPNLGDREALFRRLSDMMDRRRLANDGPLVREFEQRVATLSGSRYCVATCNATAGLQLCVKALGLAGEVILPSLTFIATPHAIAWQGLRPVFCDVDPNSHNLDPRRVARLIGPQTGAILGVHLWGRLGAVDDLSRLARSHHLPLLFDAAHAFGCARRGVPIGAFGTASVLSFHATKIVNCGEGGAVLTNDAGLADHVRHLRNFGFVGTDQVAGLGINAKMSELSAALGLTSLDSFADFLAVNRRNYLAYQRGLSGMPGLRLIRYDPSDAGNYQYVIIEMDERSPMSRDALVAVLEGENVLARRYFYPGCHRCPPYGSVDAPPDRALPVSERLCNQLLALPTGTAVSESMIQTICNIVRLALRSAPQVRGCLTRETSEAKLAA